MAVTYKKFDGGIWYNLAYGTITLYDDYLDWAEGLINPISTSIAYSDIISVSSSDGGFFNHAFIQVNTAGRSYTISALGKIVGYDVVAQKIREKAAAAKSKPRSASKTTAADEVLGLKKLLDSGIITQSEFEAKKKQLLGL